MLFLSSLNLNRQALSSGNYKMKSNIFMAFYCYKYSEYQQYKQLFDIKTTDKPRICSSK